MELIKFGLIAASVLDYYNSTVANRMRTEILELRSELNAATSENNHSGKFNLNSIHLIPANSFRKLNVFSLLNSFLN